MFWSRQVIIDDGFLQSSALSSLNLVKEVQAEEKYSSVINQIRIIGYEKCIEFNPIPLRLYCCDMGFGLPLRSQHLPVRFKRNQSGIDLSQLSSISLTTDEDFEILNIMSPGVQNILWARYFRFFRTLRPVVLFSQN